MGFILALLAVFDQYDAAAEKVRFPDGETQRQFSKAGAAHRKIVNLITDRQEWAKAFRTIHDKIGRFPAEVDILVVIEETDDKRPACGLGKDGRGTIKFNMKQLGPYQQKLDDFEVLRQSGSGVRLSIPPSRIDAMITHELTHVICGGFEELWLTEGVASYTAGDDAILYDFHLRGAPVTSLDQKLSETDSYGRGLSFFRWIEKEFGPDKIRAYVKRIEEARGEKAGAVAAEVLGRPWDQLLIMEQAWSAEYLAGFKGKP